MECITENDIDLIKSTAEMVGIGFNTFHGKVCFTEHVDKSNMKQVHYYNLIAFHIKLIAKGKIKQKI